MRKYKIKTTEMLNKSSMLKKEKLIGSIIKKWEPHTDPTRFSSKKMHRSNSIAKSSPLNTEEKILSHISGAVTSLPVKNIVPRQHISER